MFSETVRIKDSLPVPSSAVLDLKRLGRSFFGASGCSATPQELTLNLNGVGSRTIQHPLVSSSGRWSWKVRDALIQQFKSDVSLGPHDELIVQRTKPNEIRISPTFGDFDFIDLFAGIGGIRIAFETVGGSCVFSSEWDELAQDTYEANFDERPEGDITKIPEDDIPTHDILVGGFPCQPFSIIGNRRGFTDTRGTLFFDIERILRAHRPRAVLLENVKQFRTHDKGKTCRAVMNSLSQLGYHPHVAVLNALDFGVAQKRERTFIVGFQEDIAFRFPEPFGWYPSLSSVFEPDDAVDPKLIASEMIQEKRLARIAEQGREPFYPSMWHENKGGHIGMHPFSCALRHNASYNYLLVNGMRRPSGREMLRLQGYPESFKIVVKHSAIRAQCGNSVAVPVVVAIASNMVLAMRLAAPRVYPVQTKSQLELFAE